VAISVPGHLAPKGPLGPAPRRRPGSIRRTTTIDMRWPAGPGTELRIDGNARDLRTPIAGAVPEVLYTARFAAGIEHSTRTIQWLETDPRHPGTDALVGMRGGGNSRGRLAEALEDEATAGTALYLMLDDIAAASLIAGFAYSRWFPRKRLEVINQPPKRSMTGVCVGFMPGSGALMPDGSPNWDRHTEPVQEIDVDDDPWSWHQIETISELSMRRARRIDIWIEGDKVFIDSMFQDSSTEPSGGRVAVHEYRLTGEADIRTGRVTRLAAEPRVLPFRECPLAARSVEELVGLRLRSLRAEVLTLLAGTAGCTHLNDAMRALAEVPGLAEYL
jgi:hypothetical protein